MVIFMYVYLFLFCFFLDKQFCLSFVVISPKAKTGLHQKKSLCICFYICTNSIIFHNK
ncbi:hypothetical protein AAHE18_18G102300 [Arachis hypogaea]